jgi:peptidoglycan/LPS O-acetylase OafA/YrhL
MEVTLRLLSGILACVKGVSFAASGSLMMPPPFSGSPLYFWFSWAIGAALAEAFLQRRKLPFHMSFLPWLTLAIAVYFFKPFAPLSFLFFAVATVCFLSNRVETKMPTGIPGVIWGRLGALGIISYSVYLLHDPIVRLIVAVARRILPNSLERPEVLFLAGCSAIVPVVLVSWGFYVLVERPSIAIGKKIIDVSRNKMCALGETQ